MRTDYNKKLAEWEKLKIAMSNDGFRALMPSEADLKILKELPVRPNNPSVPAPYAGPMKVETFKNPNEFKIKSAISPGLNTQQYTDISIAADLTAGKSYGTSGWGTGDKTVKVPGTNDGSENGIGLAYEALGTNRACKPHYMVVQVGMKNKADTATGKKSVLNIGSKKFKNTFDAFVVPTAAKDPDSPNGAVHLAAYSAVTIFMAFYI